MLSSLQKQCSCFDCLVVTTVAPCLNMQEPSFLHFSSILHRVAIPVVSYTNLVYVGRVLLECTVYVGCYRPPHSNSIASCMSKHSAAIVTTKQSSNYFVFAVMDAPSRYGLYRQ